MKKSDYFLITATLAYSYLFYKQNAGVNFLLFNLFMISGFALRDKQLLKQPKWLWAAALTLISACGIFIHSSALAIIGNICGLLVVSGLSFNTKTSFLFNFIFSLLSETASLVYIIIDMVYRKVEPVADEKKKKRNYKIVAVLISLVLGLLFLAMYRNANPLFAENTKWINLDFLSAEWIGFTIAGFLLVYPMVYHKTVPQTEQWENNLPEMNALPKTENLSRYETERFGGILLFAILNLMLVILNIGDINTIWLNGALPKGITHSDFVHNGVGMIILSIVLATSLMMFLFRSNFDQIKNSKMLKWLVYVWVLQNLLMLFSTAWRNQIYIHAYNLTYKRMGVYIWLGLAAIGLLITIIKIWKEKSNWYLIKSNFALWISVLCISGILNWDLIITRYNIGNKDLHNIDFYYLFTLSDSNLPELLAVTKEKEFGNLNSHLKDFTADYRNYHRDYLSLLNKKIEHFLSDYKSDWRSYDLRDQRIMNALKLPK